jgi:ferritin-like metal-binding protein YciE
MSDSADNLLQQLGGVGSPGGESPSPQETVEQKVTAVQSSEQPDHWHMLLVDLVYLINGIFRDVQYWEGVKTDRDTIKEFVKILHELQQLPQNDGVVRIEHRGSPGTKVSEKTDYVIRLGDLKVDIATVSAITKRIGIRVKHIEGRLIKSFEAFSAQGLDTIFIKIPDASDESLEIFRVGMRIISCFNKAVEDDASIEYVKKGQSLSLNPVLNEFHQPDPNLTQLAALNDLSPKNIQEMIQRVAALMKRPDFARSGQPSANVYQTIFNIKSLRQKLVRPAIELNSDRAPKAAESQKGGTGGADGWGSGPGGGGTGGAGGADGRASGPGGGGTGGADGWGSGPGTGGSPVKFDPAVRKANMAKFVKEAYGDSPETAVQVMKTIYNDDYHQLDLSKLEGRLQLITDLLSALESNEKGQELMENVLERIQTGMDQLPKDVLDDLIIDGDEIKIWENDEEKVIGKSDDKLLNLFDASKDRSAARKKKRTALRADRQFTDPDYEQLSKTFNISIQEAEEIANLLKSCFDGQGNFQRALFEKNVPGFADHPQRIFEILWEFLKEIPRRSDRLPFLNSLQLLVKDIKQPRQAIKILVSDFILDPVDVGFPDRNALMLAIQFLRTYNKEINMDIEITPEEVMMVNIGLDPGVTRYVVWKIDGEQKRFIEKIVTIRKKLIQSFEQEGSELKVLPIRFLLALEREAHIFLALVGGKTATAVIQGALNVYGNPASQVFLLKESANYMTGLLQHLGILIRGIGRVGQPSDFALLDEIQKRQQGFMDLSPEPRHQALVQRILGGIESAKHEISTRNEE